MEPKKNKINHIIFIFFVYAVVSVQARILSDTNDTKDEKLDKVCMTPSCMETASRFLKNMDVKVDPCDNFYKFACGGYINLSEIPERAETFDEMVGPITNKLIMLIEEDSKPSEPKAFKIIKKMYKYCMKARSTEKGELDSLFSYIEQFGGWPVLKQNNWNESAFDWRRMNYKVGNKTSWMNFFVKFEYYKDPESHIVSVFMYEPSLTYDFNNMLSLAISLGADPVNAHYDMEDAFNFEMELAKILYNNEHGYREPILVNNNITVGELIENYPFYPWKEVIVNQFPLNITIKNDTIVYLNNPDFMKKFEKLIEVTSNRTIANYAIYKEISKHSSFINFNKHIKKNSMSEYELSISKRVCFNEVSRLFPLAVGVLYGRKYSNESTRVKTNVITENIYNQFSKMLNNSKILDDETKEIVFLKFKSMTLQISHKDEIFDDSILDEQYKNFEVIDDGYLNNRLRANIFNVETYWVSSTNDTSKTDWIDSGKLLHTLQSQYILSENTIVIPAAMLQGIFFNIDRPDYINYGAIGSIIGHEITHGFDNTFRYFDNRGNLVDSWTSLSKKRYDEKIKCLVSQYENFTIPETNLRINGKMTLNENICDNGGIRAAYFAYKNTLIDQPEEEKKLPKLDYTPSQLFWLSTANLWCKKSIPSVSSSDIYSPNEFRVNGMLSNSQEFANDFNCPIDSKMNPKNKCIVW